MARALRDAFWLLVRRAAGTVFVVGAAAALNAARSMAVEDQMLAKYQTRRAW